MQEITLKEVSKIINVEIFVLVEYLFEQALDIELEEAFEYKISRFDYQDILDNKIELKQMGYLRVAEINFKLSFLKKNKHTLENNTLAGSHDEIQKSQKYIKNELDKVQTLVDLIEKQREQMRLYVEGSNQTHFNNNSNNKYYLYNSTGFVMQVDDLEDARDQAKHFSCIIKDIRDNIVR